MTPRELFDSIPAQPINGLLLKVATADVIAQIATEQALVDELLQGSIASADQLKQIPAYLKAHGKSHGAWLVSVQSTEEQRASKVKHRKAGKLVLYAIGLLALAMVLHATGVITL